MIGHGMMGWGSFGSLGWIGMIINLVITILVIGGIIWMIAWMIRRVDASNGSSPGRDSSRQSPKEILQSRYARGEITREEFRDTLADLS